MKRTVPITVIGMLTFACVALAQPRPDATLLAAARIALPRSISTSEISRALDLGLWNSNRTALAICFTNSKASTVFVFVKQKSGKYLAVDASIEGLGIGAIGIAGRSAYERLELTPVQWLHRDDGTFMVLMRRRKWGHVSIFNTRRVWVFSGYRSIILRGAVSSVRRCSRRSTAMPSAA